MFKIIDKTKSSTSFTKKVVSAYEYDVGQVVHGGGYLLLVVRDLFFGRAFVNLGDVCEPVVGQIWTEVPLCVVRCEIIIKD